MISAKFQADFTSFQDAAAKAALALTKLSAEAARIPDEMNKIGNSLSGAPLTQDATKMATAVEKIGDASKVTETELAKMSTAAQQTADATSTLGKSVENAGQSAGHFIAEFVSAEAIWDGIKEGFHLAAEAAEKFFDVIIEGAQAAHIEENFERLTEQAGLLAHELMGDLRTATHGTITDLELMKTVNQDLTAGMKLTDAQFSTLAKGAYALSQVTGVSVTDALKSMNDAMLTGRTRSIALLTGKIDLAAAEERYAKSLGTTADHLSDTGKLEATRLAILDKVAETTARVGEQTEGLDVKLQQAKTSWANFEEALGKVVAKSDVLKEALQGVEDIFAKAFGDTQEEAIKRVARAIDDAVIAVVHFAQSAVEAGGFVIKEFYAVQKVFGDVAQILDGVRLAALYTDRAMVTLHLDSGRAGESTAQAWKRVDEEIGNLLTTMKERGTRLQEADAAQAAVDKGTSEYVAQLVELEKKLRATQAASTDFVGPLLENAKAHHAAGAAAGEHGESLTKAGKGAKDSKDAFDSLNLALKPIPTILDEIDGNVLEGTRYLLQHGAKVEEVAKYYGLFKYQVEAVAQDMKFQEGAVAATDKAFKNFLVTIPNLTSQQQQLLYAVQGLTAEGLIPLADGFDLAAAKAKAFKEEQDRNLKTAQVLADVVARQSVGLAPNQQPGATGQIAEANKQVHDFTVGLTDLTKAFADLATISGASWGGVAQDVGKVIGTVNVLETALKSINDTIEKGGTVSWAQYAGAAGSAIAVVSTGLGFLFDYMNKKNAQEMAVFNEWTADYASLAERINTLSANFSIPTDQLDALQAKLQTFWNLPAKSLFDLNNIRSANAELDKTLSHMEKLAGEASSRFGPSRAELAANVKDAAEVLKFMEDATTTTTNKITGEVLTTSQFTTDQIAKAYYAWQKAMADAGDTAAQAWVKAHDDVIAGADAAQKALDDLTKRRDALAQQISQEAPEEVMGVIETQMRGQMAALDAQIAAASQSQSSAAAQAADASGDSFKKSADDYAKYVEQRTGVLATVQTETFAKTAASMKDSFVTEADAAASTIQGRFASMTIHVPIVYDIPDSPSSILGAAKLPVIPQATGGDWLVRQPTLFLAGEAGTERATFTPIRQAPPTDMSAQLAALSRTLSRLPRTISRAVSDGLVGITG